MFQILEPKKPERFHILRVQIQFGIIISIWDVCSFFMQMQSEQIIILATSGLETQSYIEIDQVSCVQMTIPFYTLKKEGCA